MYSHRFRLKLSRRSVVAAMALAAVSALARVEATAAPRVGDFCFLQISDIHVNPQPYGVPDPKPTDRSVRELAWFCGEAAKPQVLEPLGITTPKPSFVVATGDLTEYGVIHKTWDNFERYLEPLTIPLYVTPGNHDNTWTAMQHIMRKRHGGDHYSFDKFGCHFASINTATIQEPVPSIERRTLQWLRHDLGKVPKGMPVFLFCHHPLGSGEFAKPVEQLQLLEVIGEHNVVLLLMGHGHGARHARWGTLDGVMGGSIYGPNTGYSIISVIDGTLRVVYRYQDPSREMKVLLEKPVAAKRVPRVEIVKPAAGAELPIAADGPMRVVVRVTGARAKKVTATLGGGEAVELKRFSGKGAQAARTFVAEIPTRGLTGGRHSLHVTAECAGTQVERVRTVLLQPEPPAVPVVKGTDAGMKAAPLLTGGQVIVSTTAGRLEHFPQLNAVPPVFEAGAEIIHAPAVVGRTLYFNAAEKGVHAVSLQGKLNWRCDVGAVVYGTPAVGDERVHVGDLEGLVHAIDRKRGEIIWSKRHAQFSIEQSLLLHEEVLYFGAWDGFVYAVDVRDGSLKWKVRGPAGHREERKYKSRYYAPADCTPIIVGDRLFVTDRAYVLGSYSLAGEYLGETADGVSGIGSSEDGKSFYARGSDRGLTRYDGEGKRVWSNPVKLGRFPIPPTEAGGRVYVCSNRGLLTVHAVRDGKVLWKYQVTPQSHVMAPVAVGENGKAYVAGMDGTVTQVMYPGE